MSTIAGLMTITRLAPDFDTTVISDANALTLFQKAQIDLAVRGKALRRSEKVNVVANQAEYVVSGASSVLTGDDFLGIDSEGDGVQFDDGGTRWVGASEFRPVTKEWLTTTVRYIADYQICSRVSSHGANKRDDYRYGAFYSIQRYDRRYCWC